ncbi:class I SAM-dependent methyltransferase [Chryseolinea sp. T2]|uniref:class I SAM-dependent methyltransferase n=1 Tax=Chryseolinea sp. T2 TaxID=3129255 RepID=UPI0030769315
MTQQLTCPICHANSFTPFLKVKDHTVSQETFEVLKCNKCSFLLTHPIPADLGKYYESVNYISHSNQTTTITDALYKIARGITLKWKTNLITEYNSLPTKTLLDYGCGTGAFLTHAKKYGWDINGVEPAHQPREIATSSTKVKITPSIQELPSKQYSVITLWHVIEHVHQLHETLNELTSRLENNGTIFIAVPNHSSKDAQKYREHWAAYDTPRHLWHFSKSTMLDLLKQHGLTPYKIVPMKLDALYVSILSEQYKASRKSAGVRELIRGIISGLQSNLAAIRNKEYSSLIYIARK